MAVPITTMPAVASTARPPPPSYTAPTTAAATIIANASSSTSYLPPLPVAATCCCYLPPPLPVTQLPPCPYTPGARVPLAERGRSAQPNAHCNGHFCRPPCTCNAAPAYSTSAVTIRGCRTPTHTHLASARSRAVFGPGRIAQPPPSRNPHPTHPKPKHHNPALK